MSWKRESRMRNEHEVSTIHMTRTSANSETLNQLLGHIMELPELRRFPSIGALVPGVPLLIHGTIDEYP